MKDSWFRPSVVPSPLAANVSKTDEDSSGKAALCVTVIGSELLDNSNSFHLTWTKGQAMDTTATLKWDKAVWKGEKYIIKLLSVKKPHHFYNLFQISSRCPQQGRGVGGAHSGIPLRSHGQGFRNSLPKSSRHIACFWAVNPKWNEGMETEVHHHCNKSSTRSKPIGSSWSMPLHCPPAIVHLCSLGHPKEHSLLLISLWYFSHVFLSPFPFVEVFHSMIWLLRHLPSCLLALHHLFCLLPCQKAL